MLYNKAIQAVSKDEHEEEAQLHGITFAELVAFMKETKKVMIVLQCSNWQT